MAALTPHATVSVVQAQLRRRLLRVRQQLMDRFLSRRRQLRPERALDPLGVDLAGRERRIPGQPGKAVVVDLQKSLKSAFEQSCTRFEFQRVSNK